MGEHRSVPTEGSEENQAELRRRGSRHGAGQDTPSGPKTERTVIPAKRERQEAEADEPNERPPEV